MTRESTPTREPDYQCSECGCDMYLFPAGQTWTEVAERYRRCLLRVHEPTCDTCVIATIKDRAIIRGVIRGGKP